MSSEIFKAYDIRGIYPEQLNEETAYKIGRAFVAFLKAKTVVVGRDMRTSSPKLFEALTKGITEQGAEVIDIGLSTTSMMYFTVARYNYDAGINITASHNPKEYNGFKMVRKKAEPISGDTGIYKIRDLVAENKFQSPKQKEKITEKEVRKDYINAAANLAKTTKKFKIVFDAGNAMGTIVVQDLLKKLGCEIVEMYTKLDGTFPNHEANPLKLETLNDLKKKVVEEKADFGIATDGDADRIVFIDENGQDIQADLMTALISKIILKNKPDSTILYDLRSSRITKESIEQNGGKAQECRVGHSFIKEQMKQAKAEFAGELSGHYYLPREGSYFESPLIIIVYLTELLSKEGKTLSELIKPLRKYYHSGEINSDVKDKEAKLKELEKKYSDGKISHLDGLKIEYPDWWFNVRPSNTEPVLRLNLEAATKQKMEEQKEELLKLIRNQNL